MTTCILAGIFFVTGQFGKEVIKPEDLEGLVLYTNPETNGMEILMWKLPRSVHRTVGKSALIRPVQLKPPWWKS